MDVTIDIDEAVARIAAAIAEPARARMLFTLLDDRERTSTELALVANVSPSTASTHLNRLRSEGLVRVHVQGRHRYHGLSGSAVATALEGLSALAGASRNHFAPHTPIQLRSARTCYDHVAGALGVVLHDRMVTLGWLVPIVDDGQQSYELSPEGEQGFAELDVDVGNARASRRRFAYGCLDWSERRPHLGGALGAGFFVSMLRKRWVARERDSRALRVTPIGERALSARLGVRH